MKFLSPSSRFALKEFLDESYKSVADGDVSFLDYLRITLGLRQLMKSLDWETPEFGKLDGSIIDALTGKSTESVESTRSNVKAAVNPAADRPSLLGQPLSNRQHETSGVELTGDEHAINVKISVQ